MANKSGYKRGSYKPRVGDRVLKLNDKGEILNEYISIRAASRLSGVSQNKIYLFAREGKPVDGVTWKVIKRQRVEESKHTNWFTKLLNKLGLWQ